MTDGLKDRHREAIIAEIAASDSVERAVLFGSRATGTHTASSDVDIALFGDRLTLTDQARLAAALDRIPMAQSVDLLIYSSRAQSGAAGEHPESRRRVVRAREVVRAASLRRSMQRAGRPADRWTGVPNGGYASTRGSTPVCAEPPKLTEC